MKSEDNAKISMMQKIIGRIGNPLEWSMVDKSLLIICFWILAASSVSVYFSYLLKHPRVAPFLDPVAMKTMLPFGYVMVICWSVQLALGLWLRSRNPNNRLFAYITVFMWWTEEAIAAVCVGPLTTPVGLTLLGMAFVCFLLFDAAIALVGLCWAGILVIGTTYASKYGLFHYAPMISAPLYQEGKVADWWFNILGPSYLGMAFLFLSLFVYTIRSWRDREAKLGEMTIFLKKMFGRYISTEVMSSLIEDPSLLELGGERREVTIMMTDLRGFTALSERLQPEKVVELLNSYFEIMVETVLKYNGTINEIIGDALLVVFGAPQEMEDQAERAIACSIEMQNAMTKVNRENRSKDLPDLEMGIGINKAEVIVGNIGSSKRSKYTVVGSGVNMTSRIESYTTGGQILISESIYKDIGSKLRIDGEQEVFPKGSEHAMKIYEVGGIAEKYNLLLESEDSQLVKLSQQIKFQYSILGGKHVRKEKFEGQIIKLSKKSAEVKLAISPNLLTNIKISLLGVEDELMFKDFYGKIVGQSDPTNYLIKFTSVPIGISSYFHAFRIHGLKNQ